MRSKIKMIRGDRKKWKLKLNSNVRKFRRSELPEKYIAKILFR